MILQRRLDQPVYIHRPNPKPGAVYTEVIGINGVKWHRLVLADEE